MDALLKILFILNIENTTTTTTTSNIELFYTVQNKVQYCMQTFKLMINLCTK